MPCCVETHSAPKHADRALCKVIRLCLITKGNWVGLGLYGTIIMGGWEYAHVLAQSEAGRTPLGICTTAFPSCARVIGKQAATTTIWWLFLGHFSWVDAPALNVGLRCRRKNSLAGECCKFARRSWDDFVHRSTDGEGECSDRWRCTRLVNLYLRH